MREGIESEEQYEVAEWIGEGRSCDWRRKVM